MYQRFGSLPAEIDVSGFWKLQCAIRVSVWSGDGPLRLGDFSLDPHMVEGARGLPRVSFMGH